MVYFGDCSCNKIDVCSRKGVDFWKGKNACMVFHEVTMCGQVLFLP